MRTVYIVSLIGLSVLLMSLTSSESLDLKKINPHGEGGRGGLLPFTSNSLFTGSGICLACHGLDGEGVASVDADGNDINVVDDWRASMMANSAKDPFWQAKVSHEVAVNPQHQEITETTCTKCHAPMGHFAAIHDGATSYSIDEMLNDELAMDGVSCVSCHQQESEDIGTNFSGNLEFETELISYGPYQDPFALPMVNFSLYEPVYSEHVTKSEMCATCHTLITSTIDLDGEFNGATFVEQATYHEWLNSSFAVEGESTECQDCHMPTVEEPVYLSIGYVTPPRSPFSLHTFAGANAFMLRLMRSNIEDLGIAATAEHYNEALQASLNMLQSNSLTVELEALERNDDTASFRMLMTNLAGHKFPSGYPARRAFVKFVLTDENGDELFVSGDWDDNFALIERDEPFEAHYDIIQAEDQVQIYEMAFADVDGNLSTVLERAASVLKDNRFTPQGFSTEHAVYDTTMIVGEALLDGNFNKLNGIEGSGTDELFFEIPLNGYEGEINAVASVYYQSAPPEWMEEMFSFETEAINRFEEMYNNSNQPPILVDADAAFFESTNVTETNTKDPIVFVYEHILNLNHVKGLDVRVFDTSGRLLYLQNRLNNIHQISTSNWPGVLIIHLTTEDGRSSFTETIFNH